MLQSLVDAGLITEVTSFLVTRRVSEKCLMILANLIRYKRFLKAIIDHGLFEWAASILANADSWSLSVRKEACWALANAAALRMPEIIRC